MSERPRILVGADQSEHGDEAIRQADAWVRRHGGDFLVCHVAPRALGAHPFFPQLVAEEAIAQPESERNLEVAVRDRVARLTRRSPEEVRTIIESGEPAAELVRAAQREGATLVVVGSHDHGAGRITILGNVAESVVRHAPCSVLVARPHSPTGRVLVGTDLSEAALASVELAAEHARLAGARLTVACCLEPRLEAVQDMTNLGASYGFMQEEYADLRRQSEEELARQLDAVGAPGATMILDGEPAPALLRAASETDPDLLVLGARGASGLERLMIGRITEKVVRGARCSVLVVRPARRVHESKA